jgi:hypothetical protein
VAREAGYLWFCLLTKLAMSPAFPVVLLLLSALSAPSWRAVQPTKSSKAPEEVLRKRVQDFYTLLHDYRYDKAEVFATPATRANLRTQSKGAFLSFSIASMQFDTPKKAQVSVIISTMHPPIPTPMPVSFNTTWVFIGGNWFIQMPKPPTVEQAAAGTTSIPPALPRLPDEIEFDSKMADMGTVKLTEKGIARIPFRNVTDHAVSLEVVTHCDCLVVTNLKKEYAAKESASLVIEFDPAKFTDNYGQSVTVRTKPGNTESLVTVTAYIPRDSGKRP